MDQIADMVDGEEKRQIEAALQQVREKLRRVEKESVEKVKSTLKGLQNDISLLTEKAQEIEQQMEANKVVEHSDTGDEPVPMEVLKEIETRWESHFGEDMLTMKEGLTHMVCAHNHNADLMIHLKEAMDDARAYLEEKEKMKASCSQWTAMMPYIEQFLHFSGEREWEIQNIIPKVEALVNQLDIVENLVRHRPWGQVGQVQIQNVKPNAKGQQQPHAKGGWTPDQSYNAGPPQGSRRSLIEGTQGEKGGKGGKGGKNMGKGGKGK